MYSKVRPAMSGLKSTMNESVKYLGSDALRSRVRECTTQEDLENEIDEICDECNDEVKKAVEETRENLKKNLPKTEEEKKQYKEHIVPKLKKTMNETTGFWKNALEKVENFFLEIFKAIMWAFSKVDEFVCYLGRKVNDIFDWIFC